MSDQPTAAERPRRPILHLKSRPASVPLLPKPPERPALERFKPIRHLLDARYPQVLSWARPRWRSASTSSSAPRLPRTSCRPPI